ncbi:MAG: DUF11 domain-containing protein [Chloroflexi bacterium]|nr:MAG: DUF11 domain-containing protein [Chloroflexota bacterium]
MTFVLTKPLHNPLRPPARPSAFLTALGVLAVVYSWTTTAFAGVCTPPDITNNPPNIANLKAYAACIQAAGQGCGLDQTDPVMDVCKFDPLIHPCADTVRCTGGGGAYFINGFDLTEGVLAYDRISHTLYLGYSVNGKIGDSNGDGSPDQTGPCPPPPAPPANIIDPSGIGGGGSESYQWFIDTNCDGVPDVIVSAFGSPNSTTVQVTDGGGINLIPGATGTGKYAGSQLQVQVNNLTLPAVFEFSGFVGSRVDGLGEDALTPIRCVPNPNIDIQKSASPESLCPDASTTVTLTITNTGDVPLTSVSVTDDLPTGLSYVPGSTGGTCGVGEPPVGQHLAWPAITGSFDVGQSCVITFQARRGGNACFGGTAVWPAPCLIPRASNSCASRDPVYA